MPGFVREMKTLELSEVNRLPEELESGETIELVDAGKVVTKYVLRTGDAIQLAAALLLVDDPPEDVPFVSLDS